MKRKLIIAIDGPSGAGKSTISKLLAKQFGLTYVDTGAMYRALALRAFDLDIDFDNEDALKRFCLEVKINYEEKNSSYKILIDGVDYTDKVRTHQAGRLASLISTREVVRSCLVRFQRRLGERGGAVVEGRDIGTVVFPDADLKFYLDASQHIRGKRRYFEMKRLGREVELEDVMGDEKERDKRDSLRDLSPLRKADDAIYIDTSNHSIQEILDKTISYIKKGDRLLFNTFWRGYKVPENKK